MLVRRYDVCEKILDRREFNYLEISLGWNPDMEICSVCAELIILLKNLQLTNS